MTKKKLNPDNQIIGVHSTQILDIPAGFNHHADADVPGFILWLMSEDFVLLQKVERPAVITDTQDQFIVFNEHADINGMRLSVIKAVFDNIAAQLLNTQGQGVGLFLADSILLTKESG